jgi:multidrug efflux system membrane fusion protein
MTGKARRTGRTGRVAGGAALVLVVGSAAAASSGFGWASRLQGSQASTQRGSGQPPATAKVTRQTLIDTVTQTGELGHGDVRTWSSRAGGTVTGLPAVGSIVARGQAMCRIDDAPVVLLYGTLPAYRALVPGTQGSDVRQFEQNLRALGYDGFTVDDEYTAATARAVKSWQDDVGLEKTGRVNLGQVVYAPRPVRVDTLKVAVGDAVMPGAPVLTSTATAQVVTVKLDMADKRLAATGAAVSVKLPSDVAVPGKIIESETVIEPGEGQSDPATTKDQVTVAVADQKALAEFDQASVDVILTASQRKDVLTVPVEALLALAEGGYGVQVVDGATSRILAVQTGLFANGRVEVSGTGLNAGLTVGVAE